MAVLLLLLLGTGVLVLVVGVGGNRWNTGLVLAQTPRLPIALVVVHNIYIRGCNRAGILQVVVLGILGTHVHGAGVLQRQWM